ncbi:uncharacterized protein LOC124401350 isoform X7 [Silurus meridionalis]|uniref:uncharacterized protein LOC124401350 isoform X7 n=1 Tax=Silurus meridionalis TaxID=175797 RepID=UPI001EEBB16D|nr:uncharacterized protein LOC124401350 isoform X7 [Silurus meridionalis]
MMKLRRSSTNEEEGNQSGKRSERDQRRGGELCNGGRLLPVPAEVTHRSEEERETEPGRERERERERVTAEASQSLEQQPDGRLSIWRRAREAQTGHLNPEGFHFLQPKSPKKSSRHVERISPGHLHTSRSGTCGVGKATLNKCITLGGDVRMQRALSLSRHVPSGISHHLLR